MTAHVERLSASLADRYRIDRELGQGGMATVYLAHDLRHDRLVALKVLRDEVVATLGPDRFLQEIRTTARLQHPHILPLLESGEAGGCLFYVMPYVDGETLRDRLEREGTLPIADVVRLTTQLAAALESAHRRGVIHRDIKPDNILLSDGLPLVADFGIALAVQQAGGDRLTQMGTSLGTPAYMSPEQVVAESEIDARADLYSLACIVFEAIAGRPPYKGATSFATMTQHVTAPIPALTSPRGSVPAALAQAVTRALAKDPRDRFATVGEFAAALGSAHGPAVDARPAAAPAGDEQSIVVLPFDNLSPDPNDAYLADGLTEELTSDLARIRALRVIARNSAVAAKARTRDVQEIARLLGTRHVLEGSVRRAGAALRISAELIDGASGMHVWGGKYNGTMDDVFAMQERISRTIVEALAVQLSAEERQELAAHPIENLEAFQLYLQARQCLREGSVESLERARPLLERAVALAGENHVLLGALGLLELFVVWLGIDVSDARFASGDAYASRALALNPRSAEGLYAKAIVAEKTDVGRSVDYLRQSVAAEPISDAMAALALNLSVTGQDAEAMTYARRAVQLDPLSPLVLGWGAIAAWICGESDQSITWIDAALRSAPENHLIYWFNAYVAAGRGDSERALDFADRGAASGGATVSTLCRLLGHALRRESMPRVPDSLRKAFREDPGGSQMLGEMYAMGGDRAAAIEWLAKAVSVGVSDATYMAERSPFFAPLRGDAEFEAVVAEARRRGRR